ncbi:MAG: diguanylate cyclase [Candidatus Omnitrophica bacterium]|nr:diguanylate cyclase [Candidatus Omnitrophota bacterium]
MESAIRESADTELKNNIQYVMQELKDSSIIRETILFGPEGIIIASTDDKFTGTNVSYKDLGSWDAFTAEKDSKKWINARVNRLNNTIDIYVAVNSGPVGKLGYLAKTSFPFASVKEAIHEVYKPVAMVIIIVIMANILFGYVLSKTVLGPIKVLNSVTKIIAEGDLNVRTRIETRDELEELGKTFNYMTEQLIKMKERAENANPLTKLPGNIVIHEEITKRINDKKKFTVIYCDLDNFKAFNDKYGIGKGDEAIKMTAEIFKESVKKTGGADDFLGHEGGDDFILITTPDKADALAGYITSEFDKRIRNLYSQEDISKGYITAHARDNSIKQFPIMTISLAGVTNEIRPVSSYGEVTNIAAEVKKRAKAEKGSVFILDKRQS